MLKIGDKVKINSEIEEYHLQKGTIHSISLEIVPNYFEEDDPSDEGTPYYFYTVKFDKPFTSFSGSIYETVEALADELILIDKYKTGFALFQNKIEEDD